MRKAFVAVAITGGLVSHVGCLFRGIQLAQPKVRTTVSTLIGFFVSIPLIVASGSLNSSLYLALESSAEWIAQRRGARMSG